MDLEKDYKFDFSEIINFYELAEKFCINHRPINLAMAMVYRRLNDAKKLILHFKRLIESKKFDSKDLCNYGYWRCFDKNWSQKDFFDYGKFVDINLVEYPQDKINKLSNKKNKKNFTPRFM